MKNLSRLILQIAVYLAGITLCNKVGADNWSIGLIFGVVVISWHILSKPGRAWLKRTLFLAGSILIYQLVLWLSKLNFPEKGLWEYFYIPVIVGTFLLPILHRILFGKTYVRLVLAIPFIYISCLAAGIWNPSGTPGFFINAVAVWQAAYLIALFGIRLR